MLILSRKPGQGVIIDVIEGLDPQTPIRELFARGPIKVLVANVEGDRVRLGVAADMGLRILRYELCEEMVARYQVDK